MYAASFACKGSFTPAGALWFGLLQYKELKHVRSRNDQVNWTPHLEQVCHLLRSTPWSLRNSSGFMLPVIDAEKADDLYLPLAGEQYACFANVQLM